MKVLLISDLHSAFSTLGRILRFVSNSDDELELCFACGDITHFKSNDVLRFDEILNEFGFECIAVHGNCDPPETLELFKETEITFIHGKSIKFKGFTLHGLGGSNYTPFFTPCEYSEDELREFTKNFSYGEKNLLISHCPPYGILDRTYSHANAGCTVVREILERFDAVLCGHIHEARGVNENPFVVNPGNANSGYFAILDLDDSFSDPSVRLLRV